MGIDDGRSSGDGDDYIDFDQEISSNESDVTGISSSLNYLPYEQSNSLKDEESHDDKDDQNDETSNHFKVIGVQSNDQSTNKIRSVKAPWVENSTGFTKIADNDLPSLDEEIPHLRLEFLSILRTFTNVWFPAQKAVLPILLCNHNYFFPPRDVVICSPTGSGKTLCYVLPILNKLKVLNGNATGVFALIVAPVMNLAQQIFSEFQKFNIFGARIVSLAGNADYDSESSALFPNNAIISQAHIIVATPGRLVEHILDEGHNLNLTMLRYLVIDEADRMQDTARMEWLELVERCANVSSANILNLASLTGGSAPRKNCWLQRILVSATLSLDVHKVHIWNLRCPHLFQAQNNEAGEQKEERKGTSESAIEPSIMLPGSLAHNLITCKPTLKPLHLFKQIQSNYKEWNRIIVFVNKRFTANRLRILLSSLSDDNITVAEFSSNLLRTHRLKLLKHFEKGKIRVLVACDILSRGIDIPDVDCVVNYDVPINERIFVHRAGRTARAMKEGLLLSLMTKEERMKLKKMLIGQNLWEHVNELRADEEMFDEHILERYQKALKHLEESVNISKKKSRASSKR